jgi:anti-sigma factor (TIGR02949 family)
MDEVDRYTCELALRLLDDYLDRELTIKEMQRVQEHLETCARCAPLFAVEADLLREIRTKLERITVPMDVRERLQTVIQQAARHPGSL